MMRMNFLGQSRVFNNGVYNNGSLLTSVRSMKVRSTVKRLCESCQMVRRGKNLFVICKKNPKHKQRKSLVSPQIPSLNPQTSTSNPKPMTDWLFQNKIKTLKMKLTCKKRSRIVVPWGLKVNYTLQCTYYKSKKKKRKGD